MGQRHLSALREYLLHRYPAQPAAYRPPLSAEGARAWAERPHAAHLLPVLLGFWLSLAAAFLLPLSGFCDRLSGPLLAVAGFHLLLLVGWRRPWAARLRRLSPYLHAATLGGLWCYTLYWVYPDPLAREVMLLSSFALPVLYAPLYVRLPARRALLRSLALLGAFVALHLPHALRGLSGPFPLDGIVFPFVVFAPQAVLLAVLTTARAGGAEGDRARGAARAPSLFRRAHRCRQPLARRGAARLQVGRPALRRPPFRGACRRHRPLQGGQRPLRPRGRRRGVARGRRAAQPTRAQR